MATQLIPQQYVGRMNVVGDCFVFGAALHDNQPVYLDIAGPATSVEAVWARLAQGKEARIVPDTGSSIVLQPPEPGLYTRFQRKLEGLAIDHLLLVHKAITEPVKVKAPMATPIDISINACMWIWPTSPMPKASGA